jgi:hypothetical protein
MTAPAQLLKVGDLVLTFTGMKEVTELEKHEDWSVTITTGESSQTVPRHTQMQMQILKAAVPS